MAWYDKPLHLLNGQRHSCSHFVRNISNNLMTHYLSILTSGDYISFYSRTPTSHLIILLNMENDSCEQTQPCLPSNHDSFPAPSPQTQQVFQCPRFTIAAHKTKSSRVKRNKTVELQAKPEDVSHKIDEKLRLAAKGLRQPILGELPCKKILDEYREASSRTKKKSFFLCC